MADFAMTLQRRTSHQLAFLTESVLIDRKMTLQRRKGNELAMGRVSVIDDRKLTIQRRSGTGIVAGSIVPIAISAVATSEFVVRVSFDRPVLDNPALRSIINYEFTPSLTVISLVPEAVSNPNFVDVTVSEQVDSTSYVVEVHQTLDPA